MYINKLIQNKKRLMNISGIGIADILLVTSLTVFGLLIIIPFYNVIIVSFTSQKEYLLKPLLLFPTSPTLDSYYNLFKDGRIWIGYRTTILILVIGLPINMFLTITLAYGLSRKGFPGRQFFFFFILVTMLFNGGIIPLYLVMKELHLINKIWSVILAYGINTFYMIIMRNYFSSLPDSLMESCRLDGAGEWTILFRIILPLSLPIIATIILFYAVDRWNEWFYALIFLRNRDTVPLQLVLRSIVIDSEVLKQIQSTGSVGIKQNSFAAGMKMAAVILTMLPIMIVFPFLQKYFAKGVLVGAIKS